MYKKFLSVVSVAVLATSFCCMDTGSVESYAAESYPVQEFLIGIADTDRNVNVSGASIKSDVFNGTDSEKWSLNYVSDGVYEIAGNGGVLTVSGNGTAIEKDSDKASQRWKIEGVQKDFDGYDLYYKIVSSEDSSKALTFSPDSDTFMLSDYNGGNYQKYKINLDGIEGFVGNAMCDEGEKASAVGGLFGETVFVSNDKDLMKYLDSPEPYTIVVNGKIDMQSHGNTRIRDNKTIVGSYGANTIYDCQFRTNDAYGAENDSPSDNIIFRNIDFQAVNVKNRILINIWSSRNIWIDHCTFTNNLTYDKSGNGQDEVGKFIWVNTPYDSYLDAKDRLRSPDYITISYCNLKNRYWTVAYGTQNDETSRCRTTLCYNKWEKNIRRCPQIGNGNGHIYNNYFEGNDSGNGSGTSQIIGGDGSNIVSENCRFQSYENIYPYCISAGGGNDPYRDSGSYYAKTSGTVPEEVSVSIKNESKWYPNQSNYGYSLIDAYNTNGTDVKDFCNAYAGCQTSGEDIKYINDSDMSEYISTKYSSPFLKSITVNTDVPVVSAVMDTSVKYMFRNAGSGLYMEVDGAKAESGANVQQWGADGEAVHNTWKLMDAGDGYYYIRSCVGDGKTYFLDLAHGSAENGTNIGIWTNDESDARKFKFADNGDGTYTIFTKSSKDKSCIGVESDSTSSGANVIQWQSNGSDSQKWILETVTIKDGAEIDTGRNYMIQNVNSGQFMEVQDGKAESGANVQQWGGDTSKPSQHNVWHFEKVNWGYYYVYSGVGEGNNLLLQCDSSKDGSNIYINDPLKSSSQYFKFVDNEDGTYTIVTRSSKDLSCVEVADASTGSGANVQQWSWNDNNCQKWKLIPVDYTLPYQVSKPEKVKGDVNSDGELTIADLVMMQKYILGNGDLIDRKAGDLYEDGKTDVFDLVMMRQAIIHK